MGYAKRLKPTGKIEIFSPTGDQISLGVSVRVAPMRCTNGTDYYVEIAVGIRTITPHVYKKRWQAEYDVACYNHLFHGTEAPNLLHYSEKTHPND